MYRNNDNTLYFRDLNDINSKIMNLQDKYNNYMIENSNDKAYMPIYGSGRSGGMREYPKNYSGGALYNPMNGVSPLNNSFNVDRIKRDRLGGAKYYNVNQPEDVVPEAKMEMDEKEPAKKKIVKGKKIPPPPRGPPPLPPYDDFMASIKSKPPPSADAPYEAPPPSYDSLYPPPPLSPGRVPDESIFKKIGSYFGFGKRKPTKMQMKKLEEVLKSKGHKLGGAWWNDVAKWGKEQLKQQGDNTYAKAGVSAIDDLKLGGKHMKGGAWYNDVAKWGKEQLKQQGDNTYAKAGVSAIDDLKLGGNHHIKGAGFLDSFVNFFDKTLPDTISKAKKSIGLGKAGAGKKKHIMPDGTLMLDSMHKGKGKAGAGMLSIQKSGKAGGAHIDRRKLIKEIMASQGKTMIQASKYIKEHNLYKKNK